MLAPMFKNKYMAHALGGYQGYKYLNNEPALKQAIADGHKYFEVDLCLTTDGHVVPAHGWTEKDCERCGMEYKPEFQNMTKDLFLRQTIQGMPTMDTETLYQYMKKYPKFFWQLDLHTQADRAADYARAVLADFHNDKTILDKLLVQAHTIEMYHELESVYHFNYYQLFLKRESTYDEIDKLTDQCVQNHFVSVALSNHDATDEIIQLIRQKDLAVLVYTTDKQKRANQLIDFGANTICTNKLNPTADRKAQRAKRHKKNPIYRLYKKLKNLYK